MMARSFSDLVFMSVLVIYGTKCTSSYRISQIEETRMNLSGIIPRFLLCGACKEIVQLTMKTIESQKTLEMVKPEAVQICLMGQHLLGYSGTEMCPNLIDMYGPVVLFVATNLVLSPYKTCRDLNFCEPPSKPTREQKLSSRVDSMKEHYGTAPSDLKPLTVVQLSDIHVDSQYSEGAPKHCTVPLCCRNETIGTGFAGKFGEYNCDVPWLTVNTIYNHVNQLDPKPDFIIYTGDSNPHDIWLDTWPTQLEGDFDVINSLSAAFPGAAIYPTLGNHEMFPQSEYYQPKTEYKDFNAKTAVWWQGLISLSLDQVNNIQYGGYYTTLVKPGLRVLSINTNFWYVINLYSLLNFKVPAYQKQMDFISQTLDSARQHNEKVIILGHMSPGTIPDSNFQYGEFYTQLVQQYGDVIALHLFGHKHTDNFEVMMSSDGKDPLAVMFLGPSVTTHTDKNPAYRVYKLHPQTYQLLDYEQYYINLTKANDAGNAVVELQYSAKSEYDLPDMSPRAFLKLTQRMNSDDKLYRRYLRNKYILSGMEPECGDLCKKVDICRTSSGSGRAFINCARSL